jgi:hypothetical protein
VHIGGSGKNELAVASTSTVDHEHEAYTMLLLEID